MLQVLSPTYTIKIEIRDVDRSQQAQAGCVAVGGGWVGAQAAIPSSPYRWHNSLTGKTGCDEVLAAIKDALAKAGINPSYVMLEKFEHR